MRRAAGFFLFHGDGPDRRFLLLRSAKHGTWGFPKGHLHEGEGEIAGAVRETVEETGLTDFAPMPGFRREIRYALPSGEMKAAVYFLARAGREDVALSHEHDRAEWCGLAAARARFDFPDLRAALEAAAARLDGPAPTEIRRRAAACPVCGAVGGVPWLTLRRDYGKVLARCGADPAAAPALEDQYLRCETCACLHLREVLDEDLWHAFTFAAPDPAKHAADRPALEAAAAHDVTRVAAHAPGPRWLEVGSGYGYTLAAARARGFAAEGLDLAPAKLAWARAQLAVPAAALHIGDPFGPNLPAGAYHAVLLVHVIEHLAEPVAVLRRATEWLAPGGVVYLATPNAASWRARLEGDRWGYATPFGHLALYEVETLTELLRRAGLRVRAREQRIAVDAPLARAAKRALAAAFPDALSELCVVAERA